MNEAMKSQGAEKKRNQLLAFAAAAMFAIAVGVFGGLWYLQSQARHASQQAPPQQGARYGQAADLTPQRKAEYVAQAMKLREKLRPWAMRHKAELSRMLYGKAGDWSGYRDVWNAVESDPRKMGLSATDLGASPDDLLGTITFTWSPISKEAARIADAKVPQAVKETMQKGEEQATRDRVAGFSKERDLILSSSMTIRTQIDLWASGRVTEKTRLPPQEKGNIIRRVRAAGRPFSMADLFTPPREIAPVYDFLS